jgi:hypothetical protein
MIVAVLGQSAALLLVDVVPYAVYEHFFEWPRLVAEVPRQLALLVLAAQTLLCLTYGLPHLPQVVRIARAALPGWRLILLGLGLAAGAAIPTRNPARLVSDLILAAWVGSLTFTALALAVASMPAVGMRSLRGWVEARLTVPGVAGDARPWDRALPWFLAAFVTAVSTIVCVLVFEGVPHVDDSVAYLFQAKYLAQGRLFLPAPPDANSFEVAHVLVDGGRWFGKYPPGWPLALAVGVWFRTPWLVNPVLAGAAVLLAHSLVRRLSDRGTANAAVALLSMSPWFLYMSGEFMSHPLALVLGLLALLGVERQRDGESVSLGAVSGAALGLLLLTRPLEAALLAPVLAVRVLGCGGPRLRLRALAALVGAAGLVTAVSFGYNARLTGRPTYAPHTLWSDRTWGPGVDVIGFGRNVGIPTWENMDPLPGHGPVDVVLNLNKNLFVANVDLFGWPFGSLVFVLIAILAARWQPGDRILLAVTAATVAGHSLYWFPGGPDFGPRYWYQAIVPLVVLSVRGAQHVAGRLATPESTDGAPSRIAAFVILASLTAFSTVMPWRALTKYHRYRDIDREVARLAEREAFGRGLVFVRSEEPEDYQAAFNFNQPTDDAATVYAWDRGAAGRAAVVAALPDRRIWVLGRGPDQRLRVIAGPLPPGTTPLL